MVRKTYPRKWYNWSLKPTNENQMHLQVVGELGYIKKTSVLGNWTKNNQHNYKHKKGNKIY